MSFISTLDDGSSHGGTINSAGQAKVKVGGKAVAVQGATHSCPIPGHGVTAITPITVKSFVGGKLIITHGATAGCGASIISPDRKVIVE